jgi:hypothetical protein
MKKYEYVYYSYIGTILERESAKRIVKNEIMILKPSYVSGRVRKIIEALIRIIRILTLDSLSSTTPKRRDKESIKNVIIPMTKHQETPIPKLIMETASYLVVTPSICPTLLKNSIEYGNAKNHIENIARGIAIILVNKTRENHLCSLGYKPDRAKLRSFILVRGNTIVIEKISKIVHLIFIQS